MQKSRAICSVDLGINTDAVCSIMRADGTILGRKFINFPSDKDHLYHVLGRIRRFQREHSSRHTPKPMGLCKRLNMELSRKNSCGDHEICRRVSGRCNCVFEYLKCREKYPEKRNKSFHLWRKRDIQKLWEHQAHRKRRIRASRVSAM